MLPNNSHELSIFREFLNSILNKDFIFEYNADHLHIALAAISM